LKYVQFVAIGAECPKTKVFSMFESINSKGKKLEDIDLIKTYIFSKLDEESYSIYLDKWGELIKRTQDHLYDYLYNYIKAYICFYRQNISVVNFKKICREELLAYADAKDIGTALKKLLDDMYERVEFYNMLNSTSSAYKVIRDARFRFFYNLFVELNYQHPKALLLRILNDVNEGKLNKKDAVDVAVETIKYVMKFLSIDNRDSKDAISRHSNKKSTHHSRDTKSHKSVLIRSRSKDKQAQNVDYLKEDKLVWEEFPELNYARNYSCFYIHNDYYLYVFFGYNQYRGNLDSVEKIDLREPENKWQVIKYQNPCKLNLRLASMGVCYGGVDEIYILGGSINDTPTDQIIKYNFKQNAFFLTEMTIPGIRENEYFRFWEESSFVPLTSKGNATNADDEFTFGLIDCRDKVHLYNIRNFKYNII
jgi:hypothetical protein